MWAYALSIGLLLAAFWVSLWVRDRARQRLCRAADSAMRASDARGEWAATRDRVLYSVAQMQRVRIIKKNLDQLPGQLKAEYQRYQWIRAVPVILLAAIIGLALITLI